MAWTAPRTWAANDLVDETIMNVHVRDQLDWLYANLPQRATLWHDHSIVTAGNAITRIINTLQPYTFVARVVSDADGDAFTQSFALAPGTYTLHILGRTYTDAGLVDWDLDGTTIASAQDWYSGASAYDVEKTVAAISVAALDGGRHVLTGTVNGKNASSSGFKLWLTKFWLEPGTDT